MTFDSPNPSDADETRDVNADDELPEWARATTSSEREAELDADVLAALAGETEAADETLTVEEEDSIEILEVSSSEDLADADLLDVVERIEAHARMVGVAARGDALAADVSIEGLRLDLETLQRLGTADPDS